MLLIVGDGVKVFRNCTSESHDGRRCFVGPDVIFAGPAPVELTPVDDIAGKNRVQTAFFMTIRINGSPEAEEKSNIDDMGDCKDCPCAAAAAEDADAMELVEDAAADIEAVPFDTS